MNYLAMSNPMWIHGFYWNDHRKQTKLRNQTPGTENDVEELHVMKN